MNKAELHKRLAYLEFVHDQLETEISYIDKLLRSVGFPRGLISAKEVAIELLQTNDSSDSDKTL